MSEISSSAPLVSVIIPAFNAALHLDETLESVRAQNYRNIEIIVIDDGSTDDTARVAQSRGDVRYRRQENSGAGPARNWGVELAQGELLSFLDADDLWPADKLQRQVELYQNLPRASTPLLIYAHVEEFFSPELDEPSRANIQILAHPRPAYLPGTLLISPADFAAVGLYPAGIGEGIDWHLRAIEANCQIHVMPEILLLRRIHANNLGRTKGLDKSEYARILKASLDRRRARNVTRQ